jgi:hypothetical protein
MEILQLLCSHHYCPANTPQLVIPCNYSAIISEPPLQTSTELTVKDKVTMRLVVSQSISLDMEPHLGLMTRYLLLFDIYGLVIVGRPV